jgi:manganese/zinc/iron transport system permease protein
MILSLQLSVISIAILTSASCALPGVFLTLRGVAMMSDAISHAILPGIVIMFLITNKLESFWLIISASLTGIATVLVTERIIQTNRFKKETAIGIVFPLFFSIGTILISQYTRNVHLDMDMVMLGELVFAPFNRLIINNINYGPYALWTMSTIFFFNVLFIIIFYKELKLTTFDPGLAQLLNISPRLMHYSLMTLTSITVVCSFNHVGAIVVVALMLAPPTTGYLLTNRLSTMITISIICSSIYATGGYALAHWLDTSIAGSIATANGLGVMIALVIAPQKGLFATLITRHTEQNKIAQAVLKAYLEKPHNKTHSIDLIASNLGWKTSYTHKLLLKLSS